MGCGACIKSNDSQQPTHPQIPPANVLLNLITKYNEIVNHSSTQINLSEEIEAHPVLSLVQCKNLSDFIASTNGQLSDVSNNFKTPDKNLTQLSIANAAGAQTPLLKQEQRIVWKCLLLIPSFIQGPSNKISVPKFKQIITKQQQKVEESFHQISLDVNRTFPKQESLNRESLTLLLRNLVNCLSGIGYTQGMNFYAGFLLLCGFTAQQAYYIAISLFISPDFFIVHNFHSSFKQIFNCNQILNDSLSQKLSSHLNQMGITEQIYSFSWFLCSYLYTFDQKTCAIIWDYMIKSGCCGYEGGGFLSILNIAIIIMQRIQSKLLACHSPEQTLNFLRFDNLNKLFPPEQISKMLKQMKRKSEKCQNNLDYFKNKPSKATSFRKEFIFKKQFMENDKQLKAALTSKQGYQKYIQVAFGLKRDYLKEKNQVHDPKLIKVKGKVNEVQQQ